MNLTFTTLAKDQMTALAKTPKLLKKVRKCLGFIQSNPAHPGLNTHKYEQLRGENGERVFESYVENNTPSAWRVFWHYGPGEGVITIFAITPHP